MRGLLARYQDPTLLGPPTRQIVVFAKIRLFLNRPKSDSFAGANNITCPFGPIARILSLVGARRYSTGFGCLQLLCLARQ